MRTLYPTVLVVCLGIAVVIFTGSGFASLYKQDPTHGMTVGKKVSATANNSTASEGGSFKGTGSDGNNLLGFIVSGLQGIVSIISLLVTLPFALIKLGFPVWFAVPIGGLFQLIAGVGIFQFAAGRYWQ